MLEKGAFLLAFNEYQSLTLDVFFNGMTLFGNGVFLIFICLLIYLYPLRDQSLRVGKFTEILKRGNWKLALTSLVLYIGSGLLIQIPKRILKWPRPKKFYDDTFTELNLPIWTKFSSQNSFPSGHTTSAFAMLIFFALLSKRETQKYVFLALAVFAGISRVYLLEHFLMDVAAGAFGGSLCAVICNFIWQRKITPKSVDIKKEAVL